MTNILGAYAPYPLPIGLVGAVPQSFLVAMIIFSLSAWRLASMIREEEGPLSIFDKLRSILGVKYDQYSQPYGENQIAKIVSCIWCSSVWFGIVQVILYVIVGDLLVWLCAPLAISAMAIVVDRLANR